MRFTLIDLLIVCGLELVGALLGREIAVLLPLTETAKAVISFIGGAAAVLFGASPIYQRFGFRPLWLPKCPHCKQIPDGYHVHRADWPEVEVTCVRCETRILLCMSRTVPERLFSRGLPVLCLRWPEFVGVWRQVKPTVSPE
jgi:hypothetical protein